MPELDAKGRAGAIARIRELLAVPDVIGRQDSPSPEVSKASFAQEEALRKRDREVVGLARQLIAAQDEAAAALLLKEVLRDPSRQVAGELALVLSGAPKIRAGLPNAKEAKAPLATLQGLAKGFETHLPPDKWLEGTGYLNPLSCLPNFWKAGLFALLLSDRDGAASRLRPILSPEAVAKLGTCRRFEAVLSELRYAEPPRAVVDLMVETVSELFRRKKVTAQTWQWFEAIQIYYVQAGHEKEFAHLLELDSAPELIQQCFFRSTMSSNGKGVDAKAVKRLLPALTAVADRLRGDPAALARLKIVDETLQLKGQLLAGGPVKNLPKSPPRVKFSGQVGTEGGPILALPKEAAKAWRGVLRADGKPPSDSNFAGTDYGRACAATEAPRSSVGFIDVGKHRALVLGNQGCSTLLPKEGGCLLVLGGADEEDLFAALKAGLKWRPRKEVLTLSGELLLFDAAFEQGKTRNKTSLKLKAGRYAVEQVGDQDHSPWIVRLVPV